MADYAVGLEHGGRGRGSGGRRLGGRRIVGVHGNGGSDVMVRIKLQIVVAVLASAILLGVARLLPEPPVVEGPLWWSDAVRPGVPRRRATTLRGLRRDQCSSFASFAFAAYGSRGSCESARWCGGQVIWSGCGLCSWACFAGRGDEAGDLGRSECHAHGAAPG